MFPQELTLEEFKDKFREGDGICKVCLAWSLSVALPDQENVYCLNCDNRTVVGVSVAKRLNLIEVING